MSRDRRRTYVVPSADDTLSTPPLAACRNRQQVDKVYAALSLLARFNAQERPIEA
jgi:hypothetical protein